MSEINLRRYLKVLRAWLWLIVLATVIAAGASYYATGSMPRIYRSTATIMVGEDLSNPNLSPELMLVSQRVATLYVGMANRQPILEATVQALALPMNWRELQARVVAVRLENSQVIEIRVTDRDPEQASAIANEIARQLLLNSPTAEIARQQEERRDFVRRQLGTLQTDIQRAETAMAEKQQALQTTVSARGVLDLQDEIRALDLKLTSWRSAYASLLASSEPKSPNMLTITEPAVPSPRPVSPNVPAIVAMAAAVGFALALIGIFLIEYLRANRLNTTEDAEEVLGLRALGSVPDMGRARPPALLLVTSSDPYSHSAEAYRRARTEIQFASGMKQHIMLLVTSPELGDGKSLTSANLAISFAQAGKRTIIVDADLRHPSLHTVFGLSNDAGLTSLLAADDQLGAPDGTAQIAPLVQPGEQQLRQQLLTTAIPNLRLLPAGPPPVTHPGELFASVQMKLLLAALADAADIIIVDSPPVLPVVDAALLAAAGLDVLLIIEAGKTSPEAARLTSATLARADAHVLGVLVNKRPGTTKPYYQRRASATPRHARISLPFLTSKVN
jgi:polysaccharide biosynthesis transport protein